MFWTPSVGDLQSNKLSKNKEGTIMNAHSTYLSLPLPVCLSHFIGIIIAHLPMFP